MGLWSLPGGRVELGEALRHALAREVLEETSIVVEVGEIAGVYSVIERNGAEVRYHYVIVSLFASVVSGDLAAASDASDACWARLDNLAAYQTTAGLADRLKAIAGAIDN